MNKDRLILADTMGSVGGLSLDQECRITVKEAENNDTVMRGTALIAPGNKHTLLTNMLLTDLNMPNLNGIDLIKKVRGIPAGKFIPIVLLTTESDGTKKEAGKLAGASGWIVKPFNKDQLLGEIEAVILLIEENPEDDDAINRLFRAVHTLKGSGGMFGLTDIANFSHGLESVLDKVRGKQLAVSHELIDLTLAYRDQVEVMLHVGDSDVAVDIALVEDIKRRLKALCPSQEKIQPPPPSTPTTAAASPDGGGVTYRIRFAPQPVLFTTGTDPALLLNELRGLGECTVVAHFDDVPALEDADPESCHLTWDIVLTTSAGLDVIRDVFVFVEDICKIEIEDISSDIVLDPDAQQPRLGDILLQRGDLENEDLRGPLSRQSRLGEMLVDSGRLSSAKIASALSEQQAIAKQQIARNSGDMILAAPVEEADRLTDELRDIVLNIRMMPIGTTFSRFKRLVRDLSGELDKQIELVTEGAETELDKTVIDRLGDPLVHLIRNSIDHGIEHPDERVKAGKPAKGTIRLTAVHKGASVVISIIDDGWGLDTATILKKAKERGLVAADAELSEKEIFALIFQPGFSTAQKVTDVSGRGVGMDVVKREIDSLRGSIDIHSERGIGTRIDLSLPLTLAIIEGLLVHVAEDRYVIPLSAIEECLELTGGSHGSTEELVRLGEVITRIEARLKALSKVISEVGALAINAKIQASLIEADGIDFTVFTTKIERLGKLAGQTIDLTLDRLRELDGAISTALTGERDFERDAAHELANVQGRLAEGLEVLATQRQSAATAAERIGLHSRDTSQRVVACMTELQFNDTACQRIEHVRDAVDIVVELARAGTEEQVDTLVGAVSRLQAMQLSRTADEYHERVGILIANLREIARDTESILADADAAISSDAASGAANAHDSFIAALENDITLAARLLTNQAEGRERVKVIVQTVSDGFTEMARDLEAIHSIDADMRVTNLIGATADRIDVHHGMRESLTLAAAKLADFADQTGIDGADITAMEERIRTLLAGHYTMQSERLVHQIFADCFNDEPTTDSEASANIDDLLF